MNRYLQLSLRQFFERQVNFYGTKIYFISWEFEPIFSIRPEQVQCNMKQPWQYLTLLLPPTLGLQSTCHQLIPLGDFISLNVCARCSNRSMMQRSWASSTLIPSVLCKVKPNKRHRPWTLYRTKAKLSRCNLQPRSNSIFSSEQSGAGCCLCDFLS